MVQISPSLTQQQAKPIMTPIIMVAREAMRMTEDNEFVVVKGKCNDSDVLVVCQRVSGPGQTVALAPLLVQATYEMGLVLEDESFRVIASGTGEVGQIMADQVRRGKFPDSN